MDVNRSKEKLEIEEVLCRGSDQYLIFYLGHLEFYLFFPFLVSI